MLVARGAEAPSPHVAGDGAANAIERDPTDSAPPDTHEFDALTTAAVRELPVDELIDCAIALEMESPLRGEKKFFRPCRACAMSAINRSITLACGSRANGSL
ncbi:hypothetical protein ACFS07_18315 [Undibacterium arcticum]